MEGMRRSESNLLLILGLILGLLIPACARLERKKSPQPGTSKMVAAEFNQKFIEGLYSTLDLNNPMTVFETIFSRLDEEVVIYPTENYYYFQIHASGKTIWGNLRLDACDRDEGIIHIGYFEYDENGNYQDMEGKEKAISAKDGVLVKRLGPFSYSVSYMGKRVIFRLNNVWDRDPQKAQLRKTEVFVGPIFDESGLKFFLLFDKREKHFLYMLNEEGYVPESFIPLGEDVVLGRRTGFAFFDDKRHKRKILIGVHGRSVDRNNWYDGPFDQLPDNYVERTKISRYLEEAYPFARGNIDKFGGYLTQKEARIPIFSYTVYYREEDLLELVRSCRSSKSEEGQFYSCITPDPYQLIKEPSTPETE
ncbi:MAG: hypothetical protein DRI93_04695 [Aquificota bacterium]|nr:MAG: hypothetical protein DRI93_04695 [Aquificota bacterium]